MSLILKRAGIDTHSKYAAIESVSTLGFTGEDIHELICELLDVKEIDIPERELKHTLLYLIDQIFSDDDKDLDLVLAHEKAQALLKKWPQILSEDTEEDIVNEFGIVIGKKSKAKKGPRKGYKKDMAIRLYKLHKDDMDSGVLTKTGMVDIFLEKIEGMTKQVAQSYLSFITNGKWEI